MFTSCNATKKVIHRRFLGEDFVKSAGAGFLKNIWENLLLNAKDKEGP